MVIHNAITLAPNYTSADSLSTPGHQADAEGMRCALDDDGFERHGYEVAFPTSLGVPALFAYGSAESEADWCSDAMITTGLPVRFTDNRSGGVLLLAVDGLV